MQCRVTTEDPTDDFRPDTGTIEVFRMPGGMGIRLDDGPGFPGAKITPYFDSLLVKITAKARSRQDAAKKLSRALKEVRPRKLRERAAKKELVAAARQQLCSAPSSRSFPLLARTLFSLAPSFRSRHLLARAPLCAPFARALFALSTFARPLLSLLSPPLCAHPLFALTPSIPPLQFRVRGVTTNKSFLLNVLTNDEFVNKTVDTSFISENPGLLAPSTSKDRAQKLLKFVANTIVNGPEPALGATGPPPSPSDPVIPTLPFMPLRSSPSLRSVYLKHGPEAFAKAVRKKDRLLLMDTTWRDAHQVRQQRERERSERSERKMWQEAV
jgi:pyruvate carboxylase